MKQDKGLHWKILNSEYLSKKPWFTVRREHVLLPNGAEIPDYYVFDYPNWVAVIAITKEGKFVLIRQYRHGSRKVSYELSAGVCDPEDPSPMYSAQRELLEETGYGKGNWQELMQISANPGTHSNTTYCYLATDVELISEQTLEATEEISVHLLTLDEVKTILRNNEVLQAMQAAPLWKYIAEYT